MLGTRISPKLPFLLKRSQGKDRRALIIHQILPDPDQFRHFFQPVDTMSKLDTIPTFSQRGSAVGPVAAKT
jgi:hypothetical protein